MTAVTKAVQTRQDTTMTQEERELRKAEYGHMVHEACYRYGHPEPLTPQEIEELKQLPILVQIAVSEYRRLMQTAPELHGLRIAANEVTVRGYIGSHYLTGSIDQTGRRYGKRTIVELKTEPVTNSDGTIKRAISAQTNTYKTLAEKMTGIRVHYMIVIELQPGHKGRVLIVPTMPATDLTHHIDTNLDDTRTW